MKSSYERSDRSTGVLLPPLICVKIRVEGIKGAFVILSLHWFNCMSGHNDLDSGLMHI